MKAAKAVCELETHGLVPLEHLSSIKVNTRSISPSREQRNSIVSAVALRLWINSYSEVTASLDEKLFKEILMKESKTFVFVVLKQ